MGGQAPIDYNTPTSGSIYCNNIEALRGNYELQKMFDHKGGKYVSTTPWYSAENVVGVYFSPMGMEHQVLVNDIPVQLEIYGEGVKVDTVHRGTVKLSSDIEYGDYILSADYNIIVNPYSNPTASNTSKITFKNLVYGNEMVFYGVQLNAYS